MASKAPTLGSGTYTVPVSCSNCGWNGQQTIQKGEKSDRAAAMVREAVARANSTEIDLPDPTAEQCRQADYVRSYLIRDLKRNGLEAADAD